MNADETPEAEGSEPETNPDAGQDLELGAPQPNIPQALPLAAPAAPAGPPGPRVYPQHYSLLLGSTLVAVGCLSSWHRSGIFGAELSGLSMISGTFLFALALYSVLVAILNIVEGRLKGMGGAFLTGFFAIYFAYRTMSRTWSHERYLSMGAIKEQPGQNLKSSFEAWIGQFGPGPLIALLGGVILLSIFLKAFLPGRKAAPEAAQAASTRRRR
ncbi:MAG: hypothetical protein ACT4PV_11990 [Planctomycetaceae bacterium]